MNKKKVEQFIDTGLKKNIIAMSVKLFIPFNY